MKILKITMKMIIFILCLISCKDKYKSASETSIKTVDIDKLSDISSHIDTVFFVSIESNDDAVIGDKPYIKCYEHLLYIRNNEGDEIFIFDRNGKYISTLDKSGEGPDEYLSIADYYVDKDGLFIYDYIGNKMMNYNNDGKLIKKINIGNGEMNFIKYKNNYVLFDDEVSDNHISLSIYDKDGSLIDKAAMEYQKNKYFNLSYTPLSIINDALFLVMPFDYNVYCLNNNSIKPKYLLDFKRHNLSEDFRINNINNKSFLSEVMNQAKEEKVTFVDNVIQCKNWIASYISAGNKSEIILYSLNEELFYSFNNLGRIFACLDERINMDGEYLITTLQAHYYSMFKEIHEKGVSLDKYSAQIINFNADEEDNPFLCFIKLK